jgi:hypothetical protein
MTSCAAKMFAKGEYNWVFHRILDITEDPMEWLAAAKENAKDWVLISLNLFHARKMTEVDAAAVMDEFSQYRWDRFVYCDDLLDYVELDSPSGKVWLTSLKASFLMVRKQGTTE